MWPHDVGTAGVEDRCRRRFGIRLDDAGVGAVLMTLDSSVMNVSIAQVAKDVGTTVTGIQTAITLYTLVMATLMITGGKVGSMSGRRRAFAIGLRPGRIGWGDRRSGRPVDRRRPDHLCHVAAGVRW